MSSHHIVKEDQEPALIVASLAHFSQEYLGQLLEWSPTLIATVDLAEQFVVEDVKVDLIFADQDYAFSQEQTKVLPITTSFLADSLAYLVAHNYAAVNIVCDALDPLFEAYAAKINIVVFAEGKRHVYVQGAFEKWKPAHERVYVDETAISSYKGLEKQAPGIFITQRDGFYSLQCKESQRVCIAEDL